MENGQDVLKMNLPKIDFFGACRLNLDGCTVHDNFFANEH